MFKTGIIWGLSITLLASCAKDNPNFQEEAHNAELLHRTMKQITDVIVHDIFSPPVASRIYVYSAVAGYEALVNDNPNYTSLAGQLNGLSPLPKPEAGQTYCFPVASIEAMMTVGKTFVFSEDKMTAYAEQMHNELKALNMPEDVYERSIEFGQAVARHILAWADKDNYKQTRTYPKYSLTNDPAKWQPTPPDYMDGIEPSWNVIRPMTLDSAQQFKPVPPTQFDTLRDSRFMTETMEVYNALKGGDTEERKAIAKFWDCNPFVSHHAGHVMFATKKITPGGHWINVTRIACETAKADMMKSAEAYTLTSLALFDGFISCWDEKYRSQLIRPETVINKYVDEEWRPLLQTPPFPEYTSGHSVISRAAATALTSIFGDQFSYTDNSEEEFGLPARSFNSFLNASSEAAISRMYGGIHYRPAIENGVTQGGQVGAWVVSQVKMRKESLSQK